MEPRRTQISPIEEIWEVQGKLHREDGPALTRGQREEWYWNGIRHRVGGPAVKDPSQGVEMWYQNGEHHRSDGPATILESVSPDGTGSRSRTLTWYYLGLRHNAYGPADICTEDGRIYREQYYIAGQRHRIDGPAYVEYDHNGNESEIRWYIRDQEYYLEDWLKQSEIEDEIRTQVALKYA